MTDDGPPFPERDFDNHEAYQRMEQLVAEAVETLPDFPGLEQRRGKFVNCEQQGVIYDDWASIEIDYLFSADISQTDLVHDQYTDVLRDTWTEAGYDIHRDEPNRSGTHYSLEAKAPGGINLWWRAAGHAGITVQSGCVPVGNDQITPDYIAPVGGVTPENDFLGQKLNDSPIADSESGGEESDEAAVNPFSSVEAAHHIPAGRNPFDSQL